MRIDKYMAEQVRSLVRQGYNDEQIQNKFYITMQQVRYQRNKVRKEDMEKLEGDR